MSCQRPTQCLPTLLAAFSAVCLAAAAPSPAPAGTAPRGNCAVCGMFVANFPDWAASVSYKDGGQSWFDGPKDLFTFLLDLQRYAANRKAADITQVQVKDYYGLKPIDGRKAFYVVGSDVMGPMGRELVPFATEAAARDFVKDHRGQRILTFPDINAEVMKGLE